MGDYFKWGTAWPLEAYFVGAQTNQKTRGHLVMFNTAKRITAVLAALACSTLLGGCVGAAMIPFVAAGAAPLVGGTLAEDNAFVFDAETVTPEVRKTLAGAKSLTLLTEGAGDGAVAFAEYMDAKGAYEVRIHKSDEKLIPTKRRELVRSLCVQKNRTDIVLSASNSETEAGGATLAKAMLLGRVTAKMTSITHIRRCRDGWETALRGVYTLDQGLYAVGDSVDAEKIGGKIYAQALIDLAAPVTLTAETAALSTEASAMNQSIERPPPTEHQLVWKIQSALSTFGYHIAPDGQYGPKTKAAIADWQSKNGLPANGSPSQGLLDAMNNKINSKEADVVPKQTTKEKSTARSEDATGNAPRPTPTPEKPTATKANSVLDL